MEESAFNCLISQENLSKLEKNLGKNEVEQYLKLIAKQLEKEMLACEKAYRLCQLIKGLSSDFNSLYEFEEETDNYKIKKSKIENQQKSINNLCDAFKLREGIIRENKSSYLSLEMNKELYEALKKIQEKPSNRKFIQEKINSPETREAFNLFVAKVRELRRIGYVDFCENNENLIKRGNNFIAIRCELTYKGLKAVEYDSYEDFLSNIKTENISEESNTMNNNTQQLPSMVKIFISHSNEDKVLVENLIHLIRESLRLSADQIRCTSVDGYGLLGGVNIEEQLRTEVLNCELLVGVISKASLQSTYVAFELGARWGIKKDLIPLIAPGFGYEVLEKPLGNLNALKCDNSSQLHQFVGNLGKYLKIEPESPATYQSWIDKIIKLA